MKSKLSVPQGAPPTWRTLEGLTWSQCDGTLAAGLETQLVRLGLAPILRNQQLDTQAVGGQHSSVGGRKDSVESNTPPTCSWGFSVLHQRGPIPPFTTPADATSGIHQRDSGSTVGAPLDYGLLIKL